MMFIPGVWLGLSMLVGGALACWRPGCYLGALRRVCDYGGSGRFFVQFLGTTSCDFGTIARWWLACSGFRSASWYPLPRLSRRDSHPGFRLWRATR